MKPLPLGRGSSPIHDEAHNLVSREFHKAATLPSKANFFFTASPKITDSDEGVGMNNPKIFDVIIYQKSARAMIEKGEMVQPYIHIVRGTGTKGIKENKIDTDYDALFNSITSAFVAHERKIKAEAYDANEIGAKILVVCRGQQDLLEMYKTKSWNNFRIANPDVHLFALSSEFGLLNDDEFSKPPVTNMKKFKMIKKLKELKNNEKCIIFHVDMVGEGIDVPGITGVMPFRNCEMTKLVQNIGRAARLHKMDREKFYNNKITIKDRANKKWIKPYSWVIIPEFLADSRDFSTRFEKIIKQLRLEYGFIPTQHAVIDNVNGLDDDEPIDSVNYKRKRKKHTKSGIDNFEHEFENKTAIEKLLQNFKIDEAQENIDDELKQLGI